MMKYSWKHTLTLVSTILWMAGSLINPAMADSSCGAGVAVPPFLAAGVDPNLLLMIDNSASMYDLAYVKPREEGYCYDGTYTDQANNNSSQYNRTPKSNGTGQNLHQRIANEGAQHVERSMRKVDNPGDTKNQ